jgi:flagellar basal body-associated protein FliL
MATKKKLVKFIIIFILLFFVVITGLSMIVPYIGGNKNTQGTGDVLSGDILTGEIPVEKVIDGMGL